MPLLARMSIIRFSIIAGGERTLDDALGDACDRGLAVGTIDDRGNLVATQPGDVIAGPQGATRAVGNDAQDRLTGRMTQRLVDRLEVVQIEIEEADSHVRASQDVGFERSQAV